MTIEAFADSAAAGKTSLARVSSMVSAFASAQNDSYEQFTKFRFGEALGFTPDRRSMEKVPQRDFNAEFKRALIEVYSVSLHLIP